LNSAQQTRDAFCCFMEKSSYFDASEACGAFTSNV
jgi:hypothetical protein